MFYSIDLLSPKGALGNVWVMMLLFRDAISFASGVSHAFYSRARMNSSLLLRVFKKTCGFASTDDDETFSLSL